MTVPAIDDQRRTRLGILVLLLATFVFACMDATTKYLSASYPVGQIVWIRYLIFAVFAGWLARRNLRAALRSRRPWMQALRAVLLVCEVTTFILAFRFMPLADVHAIAASAPLIVVALSGPLLGERIGAKQWLAVIGGLIGVLIIVRPGQASLEWSMAFAILGAVLWALYQIQLRFVARYDRPETTVLYSALIGALLMSAIGPFDYMPPDAEGWGLLLLAGLLGSTAHYLMTRAYDYAAAAVLQPYGYTLALWAIVVGYIVFGQLPDFWTFIGAGIVTASGLYAWASQRPADTG